MWRRTSRSLQHDNEEFSPVWNLILLKIYSSSGHSGATPPFFLFFRVCVCVWESFKAVGEIQTQTQTDRGSRAQRLQVTTPHQHLETQRQPQRKCIISPSLKKVEEEKEEEGGEKEGKKK